VPRTNTAAAAVDELDDLYDTAQLAEQLHISPRTIEGWRAHGQGPAFVKAGPHRVLYRKSAIERWLHQQTQTQTKRG
jgi:predicted DNA-binding transcriptional regulator AlpA